MESSSAFAWSSLLVFWGIFSTKLTASLVIQFLEGTTVQEDSATTSRGWVFFSKGKICPLIFRVPKDSGFDGGKTLPWMAVPLLAPGLVNPCCSGNSPVLVSHSPQCAAGWAPQDTTELHVCMSATPVLCQLPYSIIIAPPCNLASCLGVGLGFLVAFLFKVAIEADVFSFPRTL